MSAYCTGKAALIGLANALAQEGAEHGVTANCIAPAVGWLAHENCTANGELFVARAGRMARAWIAESPGAWQPEWTIDDMARRAGEIADRSHPVAFAPMPSGFYDHLGYSFDMAWKEP